MPFPESPRTIYAQNPLVEVICQLRFPTILRIGGGGAADFQELIRQEYPIYTSQEPSVSMEVPTGQKMPKEIASLLTQLAPPPGNPVHKFATKDSKRFVSLAQDFIAYSDLNYTTWESFQAELLRAVRALESVYRPAFYTRVGLRYKDLISRQKLGLNETKWSQLLNGHIVGELGATEVEDNIDEIRTQVIARIPEIFRGQMRIIHGLVRPPESEEDCYLIDSDLFVLNEEGIELNDAISTLERFNRVAGNFFRWAITPVLHNAMGPRVIPRNGV